jgi:hypothetical protein
LLARIIASANSTSVGIGSGADADGVAAVTEGLLRRGRPGYRLCGVRLRAERSGKQIES